MDKNRKAYLESVKRDVAEMLAPENWPNGVPMIRHVRVRGQQVGTVIVAIEPSRYGQLPFQIGLSLCSHRDVFSPHIGIMRALTRRVPANSLLMPKVNGGYSDKGAAAVVTVARCLFDADLRWFNGQHFEEIDKYMAEMGIGKIRGGALPYLDAIAQRNNRLARKAAAQ